MHKYLTIITLLLFGVIMSVQGQEPVSPKVFIEATEDAMIDMMSCNTQYIPYTRHRTTNYNSSVLLDDSALVFVYEWLREEAESATIFTVYETDDNGLLGLWQLGSDSSRSLWLNTQQVSFDDYAVTYRPFTETGVVIHSMRYHYPVAGIGYDGHDTLILGREGSTYGDKNFCAFLCYPGALTYRQQRQVESALAVRYGALLHSPYIDSQADTFWNPLDRDAAHSFGVCGIGRDELMQLFQPRSVIRNDVLTIEAESPLLDRDYVMLGCDENPPELGWESVIIDTAEYITLARHWKLRARTNEVCFKLRFTVDLPVPAAAVRLMLTPSEYPGILEPEGGDSTFMATLVSGQDYYITLLINHTSVQRSARGTRIGDRNGEDQAGDLSASDFRVTVSPNPTSGRYTVRVDRQDEGSVDIHVRDAHGRTVDQQTTSGAQAQYTYNGRLTDDGVYYVTVTCNGRHKTFKLIVVK
jgi:hypothetical protein